MLADMVIVDQNPLQNLKVLYGTGAVRLNDATGRVERVGGISYTIKDGIVYDAKKLLADVAAMVGARKTTNEVDDKTMAVDICCWPGAGRSPARARSGRPESRSRRAKS